MVNIDEKDLYQLLIAEFRYAAKRDNHLAPGACAQHVMEYLPIMPKLWRAKVAEQLTEEILDERVLATYGKSKLEQDDEWEALMIFLTNYLEKQPYNVYKYMEHLYKNPEFNANIDYYSTEMAYRIEANKMKE